MEPLNGREAIRQMFEIEFGRASMTCIVENVFEDGEWAILEWRDPTGLRGCGFFHVRNDQIIFQRGYFDQLSFFRQQRSEEHTYELQSLMRISYAIFCLKKKKHTT